MLMFVDVDVDVDVGADADVDICKVSDEHCPIAKLYPRHPTVQHDWTAESSPHNILDF